MARKPILSGGKKDEIIAAALKLFMTTKPNEKFL